MARLRRGQTMAVNQDTSRTVLIGFAEALAAIETTWSLQAAGFRVAAFTRRGRKPALRRVRNVELHEVCPPELDVQGTVEDVRALIRSLAPAACLPLDDPAVWVTGKLDGEDISIAGPTGRAVAYSLDKELQLEAARDAGLPVPATQVVQNLRDFAPADYPVVVKPAKALYEVGGRLVRPAGSAVANADELARLAAENFPAPLLVQPLIRGTGEGLFGHVTRNGVVGWSAHRRIRMVNPHGSASSACESVEPDASLLQPAERFLTRLGWRGLFMLEFLRDAEGRPWLMELNGRAWGSLALARRRGFEYPAWTVQGALDNDFVPMVPQTAPEIVCRHLGMELVHLAFVLRGPPSAALTDWPKLWPTIRGLARISRGDRLYNWKRSEPHVLLADTVGTLRFYFGQGKALRPAALLGQKLDRARRRGRGALRGGRA